MVTRALSLEPKSNDDQHLKSVILPCIQKWFAPSGPDFHAISKMVHEISVGQKLAKLQMIYHLLAHLAHLRRVLLKSL